MSHFIRQVLELLRMQLLGILGVLEVKIIEGLDINSTKSLLNLFSKAAFEMKSSVLTELPLELAAAEWLVTDEDNVVGRNEEKVELTKTKSRASEDDKIVKENVEEEVLDTDKDLKVNVDEEKNKKTKSVTINSKSKTSIKNIENNWQKILDNLRPQNHSVEALLKATRPAEIDGEYLVIEVFYKFHKEQLEVDRYKRMVQEAIYKLVAEKLKLRYVLSQRSQAAVAGVDKKHENVSGKVEDEEIVKVAEEIFGS